MYHKEPPSCSSQIDADLEGDYCVLQRDYSPAAARAHEPDTQKEPRSSHPCDSNQENSTMKMPPKRRVSRSKSSPEHQALSPQNNSLEKKQQPSATNGYQCNNSTPFVVSSGRRSNGHVRVGGRRSTGSLTGREPFPPLRYFTYLAKFTPTTKAPQRARLPSAHDILADRPVLLTSTSIVSPFATNVLCQEIEEIERQERQAEYGDLLDCCTCMCCVKALFYHCTHDSKDEGKLAEHPCSCKGPMRECVGRWGTMGLVSIFLPCLLCYLPFEVCFRCHNYARREEDTKRSRTSHLHKINYPTVITEEST